MCFLFYFSQVMGKSFMCLSFSDNSKDGWVKWLQLYSFSFSHVLVLNAIFLWLSPKLTILQCVWRKLSCKLFGHQRTWLGAICCWLFDPTLLSSYKVWVAWWWQIQRSAQRSWELFESGDMSFSSDLFLLKCSKYDLYATKWYSFHMSIWSYDCQSWIF